MFEFEAFGAIRDFVETGGDVMLVIAGVTFWMWWLILERFWYFRWVHPKEAEAVKQSWNARADQRSWNAHQIRELLISEVELKLQRGLLIIKSLVALCPMLGLMTAAPLVMLYAFLSTSRRRIVSVLNSQSAGLIALRVERLES